MKRIVKIGLWNICIMAVTCIALLLIYNQFGESNAKESGEEKPLESMVFDRQKSDQEFLRSTNSVKGHNEQDTIVGNFTGKGTDTLFVCYDHNKEDGEKWQFYAKSSNKKIPRLNLWGFLRETPKLVNEGDLDGNGTCEVGYLHTWMNSQWRTYRVFTFLKGKWCYLIDPGHEYMETGNWIRTSGKEIVEPSDRKGWIKVNYQTQGVGAQIRDTIVRPDYSPIDD